MSVQGIQPKLSAILRVTEERLEVVDRGGRFILKPCPTQYVEVPENEALTMTLAAEAGIDVPDHGLVYASDGSFVYWVRRFDRAARKKKLSVEDFAQLGNRSRDTKYDSSMENVVKTIDEFTSIPANEKRKLARRVCFCFLTGNEDMHLKNFSLIVRDDIVELSPAYDLLNSTIMMKNAEEEMALPIHGKKAQLTKNDVLSYLCGERMKLRDSVIESILESFRAVLPRWRGLIGRSMLSPDLREAYQNIVDERATRLGLNSG
jgi:serine/threonine-protein kinase HipA